MNRIINFVNLLTERMTENQFEIIFKQYFAYLSNVAYGMLRDEEDSYDIVQQVFVKFWDKRFDVDIDDRDELFGDAAYVIVNAQQGSASLLQRKLKLGYNRAGRIIDQLEAAGIVGPFEGSKARQVLITDILALEELLKNE